MRRGLASIVVALAALARAQRSRASRLAIEVPERWAALRRLGRRPRGRREEG